MTQVFTPVTVQVGTLVTDTVTVTNTADGTPVADGTAVSISGVSETDATATISGSGVTAAGVAAVTFTAIGPLGKWDVTATVEGEASPTATFKRRVASFDSLESLL